MLNGDEKLQISYSTGMTVLSLLVPILVLLLAFLAVSGSGRVRWWRIGVAGLLSGGAICGMHYLADASISNYVPMYRIGYVVGTALIAVSASTAALAIFFVFEAAWRIVWWKRIGCAMVLAGAVSGMHWCAAVGTSYEMMRIRSVQTGMSSQQTLIMVIVLVGIPLWRVGRAPWSNSTCAVCGSLHRPDGERRLLQLDQERLRQQGSAGRPRCGRV